MYGTGEWTWSRRPHARVWHLTPAASGGREPLLPPCGAVDVTAVPIWDSRGMLAEDAELCRACLHAALRSELALARVRL